MILKLGHCSRLPNFAKRIVPPVPIPSKEHVVAVTLQRLLLKSVEGYSVAGLFCFDPSNCELIVIICKYSSLVPITHLSSRIILFLSRIDNCWDTSVTLDPRGYFLIR